MTAPMPSPRVQDAGESLYGRSVMQEGNIVIVKEPFGKITVEYLARILSVEGDTTFYVRILSDMNAEPLKTLLGSFSSINEYWAVRKEWCSPRYG